MSVQLEVKWRDELKRIGALWIHGGDPKRPHALLTSGKHSNGFVNTSKILEHPLLLDEACSDLVTEVFADRLGITSPPTVVVGSAMGAVTIAHAVAVHLHRFFGYGTNEGSRVVKSMFTEPYTKRGSKRMGLKRFELTRNDRVLAVEDVLTTGGTTKKTIEAIQETGAKVFSFVGVLVNRSGKLSLGGRAVLELVREKLPVWSAKDCPLCQEGSNAVRPKENWYELVG
jgi:orotate phosphoribosyltransferase